MSKYKITKEKPEFKKNVKPLTEVSECQKSAQYFYFLSYTALIYTLKDIFLNFNLNLNGFRGNVLAR